MNTKIIFPVLVLLIIIPIMSTITAQEDVKMSLISKPVTEISQKDVLSFYAFVQIIHRDSDGNLLAYIESDDMQDIDKDSIIELINYESSQGNAPIYQVNANTIEVITRQQISQVETIFLSTDSKLVSNFLDKDGKEIITLRFTHDGYMAFPGDTVITYWNFVKIT